MKKMMLVFCLLILLFLSSCEQEEIVTPEIKPKDYTLSVETLESFFTLESSVVEHNRAYSIQVTLTPKFTYSEFTGTVSLGIYYEYTYLNVLLNHYIEDSLFLDNKSQSSTYPIQYSNNLVIVDILILEATGSFQSMETIEVNQKTYTEPFDHTAPTSKQMETYIELKNHVDALNLSERNMITKYTVTTEESIESGETTKTTTDYYEYLIRDPFYYRITSYQHESIRTTIDHQDMLFTWLGEMAGDIKLINLYVCHQTDVYPCILPDDSVIYDTINLKFSKMSFEKDGQDYIVRGLIKDLLKPYEYVSLVQLFEMMGLTQYIVDQATFELTLNFEDFFFQKTIVDIQVPTWDLVVKTTTSETYTFEDIIPINPIDDQSYQITLPGSISAVYQDTDLLSEVSGGGLGQTHVYRSYLQKGVYSLNKFDSLISYSLFDEYGEEVRYAVPHSFFSMPLIEIPADGLYYLMIDRLDVALPPYRFQLIKTEMNDFIFSPINLSSIEDQPFSIENKDDLVRFVYTTTQKVVLTFSINSDQAIKFYTPYVNDQITMTQLKTISIGLIPGTYDFYIGSVGIATGTIHMDVTVLPNIYSISQTTWEITENFFSSNIFYGGNLGRAYFLLNVTERTTYRFEMTFSYVTLYQKIGSNYYTMNSIYPNGVVTLDPGTYYLSANSGFLSQGNIRYTKQ